MSIFRPHKSKPRQFNYIPRHYDPVKEEWERRRRELHGTSSGDDEAYSPGRYIRTQREARELASESRSSAGIAKMRTLLLAAVAVVVAMMVLVPRIMSFVERANEEKMLQSGTELALEQPSDTAARPSIVLHEQHADIDFREFETLSPDIINEIEEWQNSVGEITIYDDDVEIRDGKRVE